MHSSRKSISKKYLIPLLREEYYILDIKKLMYADKNVI